jgi:HEAT repeat protein
MNEKTKTLIRVLLTDSDPDSRRKAAEDLSDFNDINVPAVLSIALQDENKGVEDAVSRSLLSIGGVGAARLIVHYLESENITSRNLAAKLLIKLGEKSVPALVPYLRDSNKDVRKIAVDILGEIKSKEAIYYLLPLLRDPDPNVLVSVLEALGNIGSNEALEPICATFEQYPFAQIVAIEALGKIGGSFARFYIEGKFKEALAAESSEAIYLFALLDAMGAIGNNETLKVLLDNYGKIKEPLHDVLLHEMVQIIERCDIDFQFKEETRDDLLRALNNDDNSIKLSAAKGLVQFKDTTVTRALILSLGISEEMDFVIIAQMSGRQRVFQIAVDCLEEEMSRGRIQIIVLLGKLAIEFMRAFKNIQGYQINISELNRAFDVTSKIWKEANQEDLEIIADTLTRIDSDRAVTFLYNVMVELDPWSRTQMIDQLGNMSTKRAFDCIALFTKDENEMVRDSAISVLQAAGYPIGTADQTGGKE